MKSLLFGEGLLFFNVELKFAHKHQVDIEFDER